MFIGGSHCEKIPEHQVGDQGGWEKCPAPANPPCQHGSVLYNPHRGQPGIPQHVHGAPGRYQFCGK